MHHHFGASMRNFGVTSPVRDHVFGTYDEPGTVTVPRRMAPKWMLDQDGDVLAEFAADYLVKGAHRDAVDTAQIERDRIDAFANVVPQLG